MGQTTRDFVPALLSLGLLVTLVGCSAGPDLNLGTEDDQAQESVSTTPDVTPVVFTQPLSCTEILPAAAISSLAADGIELTQGPGSPSTEPIFVEGQTPEELVGGISCLFSIPNDEESGVYILLSVAPVDPSLRPGIINDLLGQNLNVGQTPDGALTYWIWGDEIIVPALHNSLYEDSWYSALIQPGGRAAYDQGVALVTQMRQETTG
jgi:hypothetical protein